jgi:hypothetical protein
MNLNAWKHTRLANGTRAASWRGQSAKDIAVSSSSVPLRGVLKRLPSSCLIIGSSALLGAHFVNSIMGAPWKERNQEDKWQIRE